MKKIVLFLFLIFSIAVVNARACLERDAVLSATQVSIHEDLQTSLVQINLSYIGVGLYNDDGFSHLLVKNSKMVVLRQDIGSAITANFQTMTNKIILVPLATTSGYRMNYAGILENEAISPKCRTVLLIVSIK